MIASISKFASSMSSQPKATSTAPAPAPAAARLARFKPSSLLNGTHPISKLRKQYYPFVSDPLSPSSPVHHRSSEDAMIAEEDAELLLLNSDDQHRTVGGVPATWLASKYTSSVDSLGHASNSDTGSEAGHTPALTIKAWTPTQARENVIGATTTSFSHNRRSRTATHYASESSEGEVEALCLSAQRLRINATMSSSRSTNSTASSTGSFAISRPTFSRRLSECSIDETCNGNSVTHSPRRGPPPPIKVPRIRNSGIAIDSGHRATVSETNLPHFPEKPKNLPRRSDSQPNNDYALSETQEDDSARRSSLTNAVLGSYDELDSAEHLCSASDTWNDQSRRVAFIARQSSLPLLKPVSVSRHSRQHSLTTIQTATTTTDSSMTPLRDMSASTPATTPTWSIDAGASMPSPASSTMLTAVIGRAQIFPEVLGQSEAPRLVPLRTNSDSTIPHSHSRDSSMDDDVPFDVPESPQSQDHNSSFYIMRSSRATVVTSVDVRNLPFGLPPSMPVLPPHFTTAPVPNVIFNACKPIPSIAIPQLPFNAIPKVPTSTPMMASLSLTPPTTSSSLFPAAGTAQSDQTSVSGSPRSDYLVLDGGSMSPFSLGSLTPALSVDSLLDDMTSTVADCGTGARDDGNSEKTTYRPSSTMSSLTVDASRRVDPSSFSILSFAPEPTTPRPFPWQALSIEDMKRRHSESDLDYMVDMALDPREEHAIHFIANDADMLSQELEACEMKGRQLLERHRSEQKRRAETLQRHVVTLKAFNGEKGGRFAEKLIWVINRSDRVSSEFLSLVAHANKVKDHRNAHWKASMTVRMEKIMMERDTALRQQEDLQARLAAVEAERDHLLAGIKRASQACFRSENVGVDVTSSSPSDLIDMIQQHILQEPIGPHLSFVLPDSLPLQISENAHTSALGLFTSGIRKPQLITKRPTRRIPSPGNGAQEFRFPSSVEPVNPTSNEVREPGQNLESNSTRSVTPISFNRPKEELYYSPRKAPTASSTTSTSQVEARSPSIWSPSEVSNNAVSNPPDNGNARPVPQVEILSTATVERLENDRNLQSTEYLPGVNPVGRPAVSPPQSGTNAAPLPGPVPSRPTSQLPILKPAAPISEVGSISRSTRKYQPGRSRHQAARAKASSPLPSSTSQSSEVKTATSGATLEPSTSTPVTSTSMSRSASATSQVKSHHINLLPSFRKPSKRTGTSDTSTAQPQSLSTSPSPCALTPIPTASSTQAKTLDSQQHVIAPLPPLLPPSTKPTLTPIVTSTPPCKNTTTAAPLHRVPATTSIVATVPTHRAPTPSTTRRAKSRRPPSPPQRPPSKNFTSGRLSASANLHSIMLSQLDFMDM